ncbi:MAG: sulfur carrier protein ThiS adenylyltransferase ThiF [Sedimentisphaerales bacterium]|nr:sulfur carrier protein ThiS adenylyltransferase ThiF [Sedimentisphaerales bacterium]
MTPVFFELKNAVVGIAGLGGLGSNVAVALTRLGPGRLILADFDGVEESNLNRQQFFLDQVGMHKVDALLANLHRIRPRLDIIGHKIRLNPDNIPEIFAGCDVVAECFDRSDQKQMLVETVLTRMPETFVVSVSGLAGYGRSNDIVTRRISKRHILVGDGESGIGPGVPLTAARVGIAAHHQANAILEILMNELNQPRF